MTFTAIQKEICKLFEKNNFKYFSIKPSGDFEGFEILTFYTEYAADENYITLVCKCWETGPAYYIKTIVDNKLIYYTSGLENNKSIRHCARRSIFMFYDQLNTKREREGKAKIWTLEK